MLALSMHKDSVYVREILRAGARGYLLKDPRQRSSRGGAGCGKGEGYLSPRFRRCLDGLPAACYRAAGSADQPGARGAADDRRGENQQRHR